MKVSLGKKPLVYPAPVWIIGTYDSQNKPNVATVAWGGICCSNPACVAIALRKATYSYGNIMEKKAFTVNVAGKKFVKEADYFGMVSGRKEDKFKKTGLTAVKSALVDAPYIGEFTLVIECNLLKSVEIGLHTQFIGEIMDVKADKEILRADGLPDIEKIKPILYDPEVATYHGIGKLIGDAFSIGKPR